MKKSLAWTDSQAQVYYVPCCHLPVDGILFESTLTWINPCESRPDTEPEPPCPRSAGSPVSFVTLSKQPETLCSSSACEDERMDSCHVSDAGGYCPKLSSAGGLCACGDELVHDVCVDPRGASLGRSCTPVTLANSRYLPKQHGSSLCHHGDARGLVWKDPVCSKQWVPILPYFTPQGMQAKCPQSHGRTGHL